MEYFKNIIKNIISKIIIDPKNSDTVKAKKIIWYSFFGSIILLFIISYLLFTLLTFSSENVKVPMIEGDNIYVALKKLSDKKLIPEVNTKYSDEIELEQVYNQKPKQGSIVKKSRIVTFNVSLGSKASALPDFRGLTLFELEDFLNKMYSDEKVPYEIESLTYEFKENIEKGKIIRQVPEDGIPIRNVKKIKFWISNGPKDISAKRIGNYIGKTIEEVSKEISNLEILYTYQFNLVRRKKEDMIIIDQSIGEGKLVDEIIEEGKILILKVNKYFRRDRNKQTGTYLLDLPKKPIPYKLEVKIQNGNSREKLLLKNTLKGGVSIPIPYKAEEDTKLIIYFDDKLHDIIKLYKKENNS